MLKSIIVLASQAHEQFALAALLKSHNASLICIPASTAADLAMIDTATLRHSRLIAFASAAIAPAETLGALGYGAYNFHPGPPAYPGWAPAHFALYDGAKSFGATAHVMIERVDAGPIIGTETFIIPSKITIRELEQLAYVSLSYLFWRLAKQLATNTGPLQRLPIEWSTRKSTRRGYMSMCDIAVDISAEEISRRIAAFYDDFRGIYPTIALHGFRFRIEAAPPSDRQDALSKFSELRPLPQETLRSLCAEAPIARPDPHGITDRERA